MTEKESKFKSSIQKLKHLWNFVIKPQKSTNIIDRIEREKLRRAQTNNGRDYE